MKEVTGDLWTEPCDARVITTNGTVTNIGHGVMGKGLTLDAKRRYPGVDARLGRLLRLHGTHTLLLDEPDGGVPLVALPVKYDWHDKKANLLLIKRSIGELVALADAHPAWQTVILPRPGCGAGRQPWDLIERIIRPLLDDRFTIVWNGTEWQS